MGKASKCFTGVSRQDPMVNGKLQISSMGIGWKGEQEARGTAVKWSLDNASDLVSHPHLDCCGWGCTCVIPPEGMMNNLGYGQTLWNDWGSQWEVWSSGKSEKLCHGILQQHGKLWGVGSVAKERSDKQLPFTGYILITRTSNPFCRKWLSLCVIVACVIAFPV